jgi:antitoxin component of RelBE/YafQ-DinJ toxin-antitoxin module
MGKYSPNLSMRIDDEIKEGFVEETFQNGVTMTEVLQSFMHQYTKISRDAREKRK